MLISIIIPIYNVEKYIERCLLSVFNQTYTNIEIILVNDCSPDNSMSCVSDLLSFRFNENRVKIFTHENNQGLSVARNTGIGMAVGDYLYFLDSDDEITLDCIETLVKNCDGEDFVFAGFFKNDGSLFCQNFENKLEDDAIKDAYFRGKIYDMACNKLVKRDFVVKNELYFKPRLLHEDVLWTYNCCMAASSIRSLEKPTYIYHIIEGSLNTNFTVRNYESLVVLYSEIKEDIVERNLIKDPRAFLFLLNLILNIKIKAISSPNFTFKELRSFTFPISYQYHNLNSTFRYILLSTPILIQYYILLGVTKFYLKR